MLNLHIFLTINRACTHHLGVDVYMVHHMCTKVCFFLLETNDFVIWFPQEGGVPSTAIYSLLDKDSSQSVNPPQSVTYDVLLYCIYPGYSIWGH